MLTTLIGRMVVAFLLVALLVVIAEVEPRLTYRPTQVTVPVATEMSRVP